MNSLKFSLWIIWVILFSCTLSYRFLLGTENPEKEAIEMLPGTLIVALLLSSLAIRVLVFPRSLNKLPVFVIGLALAESISLIGIFEMPYYQDLFVTMSLACILVYLPFFTKLPSPD